MRIRTLGAATAACFTALLAAATAAHAVTGTVAAEFYGAAARTRVASITVAGQGVTLGSAAAGGELDAVTRTAQLGASGVGADVAGETVAASSGTETSSTTTGDRCAVPEFASLVESLRVSAEVVCGSASLSGAGLDVDAVGVGRAGALSVSGEDVIRALLELPEITPLLGETIGELVDLDATIDGVRATGEQFVDEEVDPVLASGIDLLNGHLAALVGDDVLPRLDASDTLGDLIDRLSSTPLLDVRLGEARGLVSGDAGTLVSRAVNDGAVIEVLPGLLPDGTPLARLTVSPSMAEVVYHRADASDEGASRAPEVRVESPFLTQAQTVREGESLRLFCDQIAALCTEVAVGQSSVREVDGRLQVSAALVSIDVATNLDAVLGGLPVDPRTLDPGAARAAVSGLVPAQAGALVGLVEGQVDPVLQQVADLVAGLDLPVDTADAASGGVRIELAGAAAQGGGAKVLSSSAKIENDGPFSGALPRTGGGATLPVAAGAMLGAGAGLRSLVTRRRGEAA